MNTALSPQQKLVAAVDNYFKLSPILLEDMDALLDEENDSQHWRHNFIRASAALTEGYAHCLRDMCAVASRVEREAAELTKEETVVIRSPRRFGANDRIKLTLSAAYKLFKLQPAPHFGGNEWERAKGVLGKRHLLMHPKTPADLDVSDELWEEIREDITWLMAQLFSFFTLLQQKMAANTLLNLN
jgi:hypothetical protein